MKAAIIGVNGQLGSDLAEAFRLSGAQVFGLTHADIAVEDFASVQKALAAIRPDVVLNTAAYHVVPKCEVEPNRAYLVNAVGPLNIARVCNAWGGLSVYYSTDYVFDGAKKTPYVEDDRPNPLNVYAVTKLAGELHTLNQAREGVVLRVSGLYGKVPCRAKGGNFITTMINAARDRPEVRVVADEFLSPTATTAVAQKTIEILKAGATGLFHLVSQGYCSWYEFAQVIFDTLGFTTPLLQARAQDFPASVRRPAFSPLSNSRLATLGLSPMPGWRESLVEFLKVNPDVTSSAGRH